MSSRAVPRPNRGRRSLPLLAAILVVTGACTSSQQSREPSPSPSSSQPTTTKGGRVDLGDLTVPRAAFCDLLDQTAAQAALGEPVSDTAHYGNGDEVEVRPGYVDVVHEYGCVFESAGGGTAKVWVFARPVQRGEARSLVQRERRRRGCTFTGAKGFGEPGLRSVCEVPAKGSQTALRARLEGLFGDSWVGCEVSEPSEAAPSRKELTRRAERWCVDAVSAAGRQG